MAHALEPPTKSVPDFGIEPYRLSARMRKTWDDPVLPMKSVGQELREERERNRKQLSDVWRALKIRPNYLAAIEEGRFEDLPGHAFTMGYVGRYARYLGLDVERLQQRLEAEIAEHDGNFRNHVDIELLPNRRFPVLSVALAGLLLAALIYAREDVVSFATRTFEQAKDVALAYKVFDAPVAALEQQTDGAAPEPLETLPFEVDAAQPVSLRAEPEAPLPVVAVTRPLSVRPELLPALPMIAVTEPRSVRFELLPPLPTIAVTQPRSVPFELLPALPVIAVTEPQSVRFELLPPLPTIAVTQPRSVPFELLPALPVIAVTQPRSVRFEFLPPVPEIAVTQPRSVRFEYLPALPAIAVTQPQSVRPELLPPLPVVAVTQPVSLRADLMPAATPTRVASLLLPMPVPPRIDVTAPALPRSELPAQRLRTELPPGTRYGAQNRNSRITLRVHSPTIVAIRDGRNRIFIDRKLAPGDTYRVPNRAGLWLTAIDANAVEIVLDGTSVGFAGSQDGAVRDLSLNPQSIAARFRGTQSVSRPPVRATPHNRATGKSSVRGRARR